MAVDTLPEIALRQRTRHREMSGVERMLAAAGMFEASRAMILLSFPSGLCEAEQRYRLCLRIYGADFEPLVRKTYLEPRVRP